MENNAKTQKEIEQEMLELNNQFGEFIHTKGIKAKFRLAFDNMAESARRQHEADKENYEAIKAQSAEENKDFAEFLRTKGLKAKWKLVVENIKKGAAEAPAKTAAQIAKAKAEVQENIAKSAAQGKESYTAESLSDEFNEFLKFKGLDKKYTVVITEE